MAHGGGPQSHQPVGGQVLRDLRKVHQPTARQIEKLRVILREVHDRKSTECFQTFFGPAEFLETVNTVGQPIYVKPDVMKLNLGIELHSFSHQLNLVTKPRLVVKCTIKP
jgi:hypothetical protein